MVFGVSKTYEIVITNLKHCTYRYYELVYPIGIHIFPIGYSLSAVPRQIGNNSAKSQLEHVQQVFVAPWLGALGNSKPEAKDVTEGTTPHAPRAQQDHPPSICIGSNENCIRVFYIPPWQQ